MTWKIGFCYWNGGNFASLCLFRLVISYLPAIFMIQGVYYYFYQIFRDKAEAIALEHKRKGVGDGSVGIFSSLVVAALSG